MCYYYSAHKAADPEPEITRKEGKGRGSAWSQTCDPHIQLSKARRRQRAPPENPLISAGFLLLVNNREPRSHSGELEPPLGQADLSNSVTRGPHGTDVHTRWSHLPLLWEEGGSPGAARRRVPVTRGPREALGGLGEKREVWAVTEVPAVLVTSVPLRESALRHPRGSGPQLNELSRGTETSVALPPAGLADRDLSSGFRRERGWFVGRKPEKARDRPSRKAPGGESAFPKSPASGGRGG